MAIIVEEPKPPRNWGTIIAVIAFIAIVFSVVYFLFFQQPVLIESAIPLPIKETQQLSEVKFDPSGVQNSGIFKSLRQYSQPVSAGLSGRTNPFLPY